MTRHYSIWRAATPQRRVNFTSAGRNEPVKESPFDEPVPAPCVPAAASLSAAAAATAALSLSPAAAGAARCALLSVAAQVSGHGRAARSPPRLLLPDLRHRPHVRGQRRRGAAHHVRLLVRAVHQPAALLPPHRLRHAPADLH